MLRYFPRYLALIAALPWAACAQMNAPLTGAAAPQPAGPAAAQPLPDRPVVRQVQTPLPAAPAAAPRAAGHAAVGDVTRALLAAQADGRRAGGALPILGPVATASWQRYLESFRQPIPEWFSEKVKIEGQ
ncbi:DUF3613 domain-containing protein [Bordetella petrii]|uniref:DUF3613 domain-containing protein n=1 Tax=Bordetella petrii TaxID=94624 RepID=UPI00048C9C39|nr:DUF3613 domain-containing protein [Bordetella petrii]